MDAPPQIVYLTHPQVQVDPAVPVERWSLSPTGRARVLAMLDQSWVARIGRVVSSPEPKAVEAAELLAARVGVAVEVREGTGEIDRSAAGFLPPDEFERVADACFARPEESVRGWERAVDAQWRIVDALADLFSGGGDADITDIAVVGHGGVGTFWYCHLAGIPINRASDQPGQGHRFAVDRVSRRPAHAWRPIDVP
jgi:broad specificity phosphatase PhoE